MSPKTFIKDLRRLSRSSFQKRSPRKPKDDCSFSDVNGDGHTINGASTPTFDNCSSNSSHTTPPPSLPTLSSTHLSCISKSEPSYPLAPLPQRPVPISSPSSRSSGAGSNPYLISPPSRPSIPVSPFAPRVTSISENSWVNHKVILIYGQIGDARSAPVDGMVIINLLNESFPPTTWPVRGSHFKALLHLAPGPNKVRLDFFSQKVPNATAHQSTISVNYLPMINCPPLHLVILLGKDSNGQFDTPSEKALKGEDSLDVAIRKFRMAAYLWQAFTQEQMFRNNFARRSFRFEEEWQTGTLSSRDAASNQMRNEAKIHLVRCDKTVDELRKLGAEQRPDTPPSENELFKVAKEAISQYFMQKRDQKFYVTALILDSHWNSDIRSVAGHAAVGFADDDISLAIFGSHGLHSYPSCIEEVVPAFTDCTRTNTNLLANPNNECGSYWEMASANIGAHLREIGRLFGCDGRESGIMSRDYLRFNRSFTSWEPFCTRTKEQGLRLCLAQDETNWHRLDALRFRLHPCFRHPSDPPACPNRSLQVWPVDAGKIVLTSMAGIAFIEIFADGDEICTAYFDYMNGDLGNSSSNGMPKQITITEDGIRARLPDNRKKAKRLKLVIFSSSLHSHIVEDLSQLKSKSSLVKLSNNQVGYRSNMLGTHSFPGSVPEDLILDFAVIQTKLLTSLKVYHDPFSISGIEFCYEDATTQFFGNRDSQSTNTSEYVLDTRKGELLTGFYVRATQKVEGIGVITNMGKINGVCGNATAGIGHTLIAPRGYKIAGVSGTFSESIDTFSLIISR
ncbi:hypothetical protein D8B26_003301 [Coccidioides posadasii str. Silveira]|uniref:Metallopeptidase n=2 Tax=Coccidioides posadasii TaxID=199306 RepID=E9D041_COCPS|nr:metallopeptidase [Coccidioides posadasii str. Silveira]KMM73143.1 metallopeptidase [Coccidioides posadasii RMSCC 3488]QVM08617.1 hypothetical protein D8B26_003301 [Coccidioides posadasii str. Silveira]